MWLALERGQAGEAERILRAMIDEGLPVGCSAQAWLALTSARQGRHAEARAVLDHLGARDFADLPEEDAESLAGLCMLAETCGLLQAGDVVQRLVRRLRPHADRFAVDGIGTGCLGSVHRYLGILAQVLGRPGEAGEHLEAALAAHRAAGATLLVAHTLALMGGDRLGEAGAIYKELGLDHRVPTRIPAPYVFRREGDVWCLGYANTTVRLKDAKGLHDIARLLAQPDVEVHVLDLVADPDAPIGRDSGPLLDDQARVAYRRRLGELDDEIAEAEAGADPGRSDKARAERDAIVAELAAAYGLGGRARRAGDPVERARSTATIRINRALARIEQVHPALGRHLRHAIRTGTFCSYSPEQPTGWVVTP